ncbi:hypothetical protein H5154_12840 [Pseudoalteromonas sp. SR44-5]|uniref:hypothetical protein n=1 Tax=Pseudoalteromonas TaxID=53246 RepID=UPI0016026567|nr:MULTISPECIES: hypothetical protein [unclassified Pseudoalteromonas]MBB1334152.1 hypothetical protein [Pseudoalteromonas sp. SR41-6]MBB1341945.1 hypothetical protein [Pseudoalteromonas sp. SR45-6]MBB1367267.1 hypothetical protein [Pseudoalteromonas sp. SR44-5]MBB1418207.1 hypothetical protein [Pseudoalteromonas sp. SG44-1]MBB1421723.1 hypothetical protein [Pseudoalteromonas sp. SG43-7]
MLFLKRYTTVIVALSALLSQNSLGAASIKASPLVPIQVNQLNKVIITSSDYEYVYKVNASNPNYGQAQLIFRNKQHDWQQIRSISSVFDGNAYVNIKFTDIPKSGDFDLLQDLRNGEDPTYILKGVAYKDLYNPYSDVPVMPSIILE